MKEELKTIDELLELKDVEVRKDRIEKIRNIMPHIIPAYLYPLIDTIFNIAEGESIHGLETIPQNTQESYITGESLESHLQIVLNKWNGKRLEEHIEQSEEKTNDEQRYLKRILSMPPLSTDEEEAYISRIKKGDDKARDRFLRSNQRLVAQIAFHYVKKWSSLNIELLELISEGNINGLIPALNSFKLEKGNKFSTYATYAIRNAMTDFCCRQGSFIRINKKYYNHVVGPVKQLIKQFMMEKGREPTFNELVAHTGLKRDEAINAYELTHAPLKYNRIGDNEDEISLKSDIPHQDPKWKEYMKEYEETQEEIKGLMGEVINAREVVVISKRFGIGEHHPLTQAEVGQIYRVSKQRIKQIEMVAMAKLYAHREELSRIYAEKHGYEKDIKDLFRELSILRERLFG